ncbi:acetate/propionate family kinase [Rhodovulum strictum]|uniref:Acetate kinase n=1 Tax=Rhodovulum strictum TaxID=58314 RepID=A0A844BHG4_9RHOB|nr:acetate/propionate family kinase [Rhodovulum strictum]MRH20403.1 acetate/propionate family kinase [Rhodovulum strictum]
MADVLTLNAGSSSLKFGLFELGGPGAEPAARILGEIDRIGNGTQMRARTAEGAVLADAPLPPGDAADHAGALAHALDLIARVRPDARIAAVGHRVVHGGPDHAAPVRLTPEVLAALARLEPLAPLHQPHNLAGVRAALAAFPQAVQVACFDTAFHRHHPWVNDTFGLPRAYYDKGVRRYGFHGLSYDYIAGRLAGLAPHLHAGRVIVAHLGNGASMCGMIGGRSIASSMGFSALDGLPMGTRCGQLDPGVVLYLMQHEGMGAAEIADLLYRQSGLLGLSGLSHDMRELEAAGTDTARQAIGYFVFRIRRELGGLAAALGGLDALVFCGGIGEHSAHIRQKVCEGMGWIGMELDESRNLGSETVISTDLSRVRILVIPTDEEIVIARAARDLVTPPG